MSKQGVLLTFLVLTSSVSFGKEVEELLGVACPIILPLPVLLWSASRFGLEGLCFSTLLVAYFAFASTAAGQGFFAMNSPAENVLSVQFYLIVTTLPLMLLAGLIRERQEKEQTLRESEARYRALVMASAEMVWRGERSGEGFLRQPELATAHRAERKRDARVWLAAGCSSRRPRTNGAVMGAGND